jgi:uncharacterized protein YukJ
MDFEVHLETLEILDRNFLAHQLRMLRDFVTAMNFLRPMNPILLKVEGFGSSVNDLIERLIQDAF